MGSPGWSLSELGSGRVHLTLLMLTATCGTGSGREESFPREDRESNGFRDIGSKSPADKATLILEHVQTNTEMHIPPVARQAESVVPARYYNAPHNINPHPYRYVTNNPNLCIERQEVLLLMMVRTKGSHVDRRMAIRDTWAAVFNLPAVTLPLVFLLGASRDHAEQRETMLENRIYRDIIQEDFVDTEHNQTLKSVMAYKWARTYCPHADYVMVTDDDVVVDIFKLIPYLQSLQYKSANQLTMCYLYPCCMLAAYPQPQTVMGRGYDMYSGHAYPAHCSSSLYIASSTVMHRLYLMSLDTPMFSPDGPWIGVLAEKLGLGLSQTFRSYVGLDPQTDVVQYFNATEYLARPVMFGITGQGRHARRVADTMRKLWSIILANHRDKPPLDVKRYMGQTHEENDSHIYQVALGALLIDLCVMAIIGYIIFCRKKQKVVPYHFSSSSYYQQYHR